MLSSAGRHGATPIEERFWAKVEKTTGCWNWIGAVVHNRGYGRLVVTIDGKPKEFKATHVSWLLHNGRLPPKGLFACHTCDNPRCVRPDHLFLGTHADNMLDMVTKGRSHRPKGSLNSHARFSAEQVMGIRASAESSCSLARKYGVTHTCISSIKTRKTWAHL